MKKIFLTLLILTVSLFAEYKSQYLTQNILKSGIPIVDIRTPGEWRETGILRGAIPIMFFDERGNYNVNAFLRELNAKVDTKKPFAIICRTGSRTSMVGPWLAKELGYNVTNLKGGMMYATQALGIRPVPYNK
ncbi:MULTISPECIES: rhodanese-like domain-containing protein [Sulfurimonas]|uniref:rhodanese-like domain-containing protein n=1 Tax=Sulfurimonas TaxID=202746 RepID=UPI0012647956|nr:rhodanese-like domain-containing protein [Sulfurimonas indica]